MELKEIKRQVLLKTSPGSPHAMTSTVTSEPHLTKAEMAQSKSFSAKMANKSRAQTSR